MALDVNRAKELIDSGSLTEKKLVDLLKSSGMSNNDIYNTITDVRGTKKEPQREDTKASVAVVSPIAEFGAGFLKGGGQALGGFKDEPETTPEEYDQQLQGLMEATGMSEDDLKSQMGPRETIGLREGFDRLTGNLFKPETPLEKGLTATAGGVGDFAGRAAVLPGAKLGLKETIVPGGLYGGAKEVAKEAGATEGQQEAIGIAASLLTNVPNMVKAIGSTVKRSFIGGKSPIQKHVSKAFTSVRDTFGKTKVPKGNMLQTADNVLQEANNALESNGSSEVKKLAKQLVKRLKGGKEITAEEVMQWNRAMNSQGSGVWSGDNQELLNKLRSGINEIVESSSAVGGKAGEWATAFNDVNKAHQLVNTGKGLQRVLGNKAVQRLSPLALVTFGLPTATAAGKAAAVGTAVVAPAKAVQVTKRIIQSPVLREYYFNVASSIAKGNKAQVLKAVQEYSNALEKEGITMDDVK